MTTLAQGAWEARLSGLAHALPPPEGCQETDISNLEWGPGRHLVDTKRVDI